MQNAMSERGQRSETAAAPSPASHEVLLTIRRIESGLPKLDGSARAYAESLLASLRIQLLYTTTSLSDLDSMPIYQLEPLMGAFKQALRPLVRNGEMLIWRDAYRWKCDDGVLANHYESMNLRGLCEDFCYEVVHDFHHIAIVRHRASDASARPDIPKVDSPSATSTG